MCGDTSPFRQGKYLRAEFLRLADGSEPARAFLDQFGDTKSRWSRQKQSILASIDFICNSRQRLNPEKFKAVEDTDGVFEFKAFQLRVFCFFMPGGRLILEFGVIKQKDRHKATDVRRAQSLRDEFIKKHKKR